MQWIMMITLNYWGSRKKHYGMDVDKVSIPSVGMEKDLSQEIANLVLKGLSLPTRGGTLTAMRANVLAQRPFCCGVCSGTHRTGRCPSLQPRNANLAS